MRERRGVGLAGSGAIGRSGHGFRAPTAPGRADGSGGDWRGRTRFVRFFFGAAAQSGGQLGEKGERRHAQGHMAVPAVPGAGLAVVEAKVVLGALKAFLDIPLTLPLKG